MQILRIVLQHPIYTAVYELGILLTCIAGDNILMMGKGIEDPLFFPRVASDEVAHAMVGFLAWAVAENVVSFDMTKLARCTLCAFLAVAIDVDHLIAAGSLDFKVGCYLERGTPTLDIMMLSFWGLINSEHFLNQSERFHLPLSAHACVSVISLRIPSVHSFPVIPNLSESSSCCCLLWLG